MKPRPPMPGTMDVLERVGFTFALDWDDSLVWTAPESIDVSALELIVERHREDLARHVRSRGAWERSRCHGGPLDGRRTPWMLRYPAVMTAAGKIERLPQFEAYHAARGKWAVYRVEEDRRAFFVGWATNRRNARRGIVAVEPKAESGKPEVKRDDQAAG